MELGNGQKVLLSSREDWLRVGQSLMAPYVRATERGVVDHDGDLPTSTAWPFARWFEGLVRPMALGAPLVAGMGGPVNIDLGDGRSIELGEWYRNQLTIGVDAAHPQRWQLATWPKDQTIVETALLMLCLNVGRDQLWEPLSPETKQGIADWVHSMAKLVNSNVNNWNMFPIISQLGLRQLGMEYNKEMVDGLLEQVDRFYKGDGWYTDGFYRQFDYYVPEAIYMLLIASKWIDDDGGLREKVHGRAAEFARSFALFFDGQGRNICYGRSRSYRFSASFSWAMSAWAEVPDIDLGLCRSIISKNISWFLEKPIYANDGRLTGGFAYANERVNEIYIGPGSCAWAFQSFLPLSFPADHPFWTTPEPTREKGIQRHVAAPNFVLTVDESGDNATLYNGGAHHPFDFGCHAQKYGKFAYSSHFGFNTADALHNSFDNAICLSPDGKTWSHRLRFEIRPNQGEWLVSRHQPFEWDEESTITTALLVRGVWNVRLHLLELARDYRLREGGTSVCPQTGNPLGTADIQKASDSITMQGANGSVSGWCLMGDLKPEASTPQINLNVLHRRVFVPLMSASLPAGMHVFVTAWHASTEQISDSQLQAPQLEEIEANKYRLTWPDGRIDELVLQPTKGEPLNIVTGGGFPWPQTEGKLVK